MGKQGKGEKKMGKFPSVGRGEIGTSSPSKAAGSPPMVNVYFPSGHPKSPLHVVDQCWWEQALTRGGCFKLCPPLIN